MGDLYFILSAIKFPIKVTDPAIKVSVQCSESGLIPIFHTMHSTFDFNPLPDHPFIIRMGIMPNICREQATHEKQHINPQKSQPRYPKISGKCLIGKRSKSRYISLKQGTKIGYRFPLKQIDVALPKGSDKVNYDKQDCYNNHDANVT